MPKTTPAYFVVWSCRCHDVQVDPADLPEKCPGHDKIRINSTTPINALNKYVGKHDCDDAATPCPEVVAS